MVIKKNERKLEESRVLRIGGVSIKTSHESKVLFPKNKITKKSLLDYYAFIAPYMVTYIRERPLTLVRCPVNINQTCFYQKDIQSYVPEYIERFPVRTSEGTITRYGVCNTKAGIVYLSNQGVITFHTWSSCVAKPRFPNLMIFDLDPGPQAPFSAVVGAAFELKTVLESQKLVPFAKLTGSKGIHVVVPIKPEIDIDEVRSLALLFANSLVDQFPQLLTTNIRKEERNNKIFIDTVRNAYTHTSVAPYSVRTNEKAAVAVPIAWDELKNKRLRSDSYTIFDLEKRIDDVGDLWSGIMKKSVSLKKIFNKKNIF